MGDFFCSYFTRVHLKQPECCTLCNFNHTIMRNNVQPDGEGESAEVLLTVSFTKKKSRRTLKVMMLSLISSDLGRPSCNNSSINYVIVLLLLFIWSFEGLQALWPLCSARICHKIKDKLFHQMALKPS